LYHRTVVKVATAKYAIGAYNNQELEQLRGFQRNVEASAVHSSNSARGAQYTDKRYLEAMIRTALSSVFRGRVFRYIRSRRRADVLRSSIPASTSSYERPARDIRSNAGSPSASSIAPTAAAWSVERNSAMLAGVEEDIVGHVVFLPTRRNQEVVAQTKCDSLAVAIGNQPWRLQIQG